MAETKVAIVTAAGRGIGAGCARALARHGYALALMSASGGAEELGRELGAIALTGSVTRAADLEALVKATLDAHGRIDAVINNTGHPAKGPLLDLGDDDWHAALDLLVLNVVRMARLVTPVMAARGGGAIVNISTVGAIEPSPRFPLSSSLRAALAGFAKLYADAHGGDNIRMNNLLPGFVDNYPEDAEILAEIPLGRYARVDEIGETAAFLVSDAAGAITGQSIRVDGGLARSI